ncbi:Hsp70 family protein [Pedobacter gandavensis]|uniref:Hsp70 family protein n=1 Tax=Pedobacter gandavensis TaxID=2679963 RepID=UPI00292DE3CD|nr:Hsp70 family protein [Pedobacter gandavensis]
MRNITFGIDLGTTNSGIAKYENGQIRLLKNPVGLRDTLPSVVSFRKGRILIGDKAREQYLSNAGNVFSAFKRKMGSNDLYHVSTSEGDLQLSPIDLSAYVLKELKNYVQDEHSDSVVITVPASFDTMQSNATKEAGNKAGFSEVVLLQEPIAACLAYANTSRLSLEKEQKWLVYDFGGGTFDAALVYINERELKVLDNKGNNFLGGIDIDYAFVEQIIIPKLVSLIGDEGLWTKLLKKEGDYEKLWHYLNYLSEESKKELSLSPVVWMEIEFPDLDISCEIEINREEFNKVVKPKYLESESFVLALLQENNLSFSDIERIILVGGTTYIPFIKEQLKQVSGLIVDDSIDPTTAVIVGAAYYAGSQPSSSPAETALTSSVNKLAIKLSFEAYSNDQEELIAFKSLVPFKGHYRITRTDGGYDSGMIAFSDTAAEFVTLLPKMKNNFQLQVFDTKKNTVCQENEITISQGLYSISGQLLPQDICIELDDNDGATYLDVIFKRNSILPLSKTLYKTFSKSITKGTNDKIVINVVEGKGGTMPGSNLSIGYIELSGIQIQDDLIEGTDIEIQVSMDESRGLTVQIYISALNQEINETFHISSREVSVAKTLQDIQFAELMIKTETDLSISQEEFEFSAKLQDIAVQLKVLTAELNAITNDRATEEKYRLDERKRKLLAELDSFTRSRDLFIQITRYKKEKEDFIVQQSYAYSEQIRSFKNIVDREKEILDSGNKSLIKRISEELKQLNDKVYLQNNENYIGLFFQLKMQPSNIYEDPDKVGHLFEQGDDAISEKDYTVLKQVISVLVSQIKKEHLGSTQIQQKVLLNNLKMGVK